VRAQAGGPRRVRRLHRAALVIFFRKDKTLSTSRCGMRRPARLLESQLITIVNIFVDQPRPAIFKYSLAWYLLAVFTVVSTVLWGRLYCDACARSAR